ncbi:MAG: hypothetical protein ABSC33_21140 [Candidatus Sulfotelmatobacter sp.]
MKPATVPVGARIRVWRVLPDLVPGAVRACWRCRGAVSSVVSGGKPVPVRQQERYGGKVVRAVA